MGGADVPRPPVHRITLAQLAILIIVCLPLAAYSSDIARSALVGGLIAIIPQAYFVLRAFRRRGAGAAGRIAHAAYTGATGKFLLSAAGFAVVFATLRPIDGPAVFAGYLAMLAIQILGSWLLLRPLR